MSQYQWVEGVEVMLYNHEIYRCKEDVMRAIKENEKRISDLRSQLFALAAGNPKDLLVTTDDGYEIAPIDALEQKFNEIFDDERYGLIDLISHNVDLRYVYENWEKQKNDVYSHEEDD